LVAGWLAARITHSRSGLIRNLLVGLIGALLGGFLFDKAGLTVAPDFWGSLITSVVGAIILLAILQAFRRT
jgi:uncharacterized membrane protein YeaQ/YmgE (transglycosylase-associated protein family)